MRRGSRVRHRTPVSLAWSTPGAALLITHRHRRGRLAGRGRRVHRHRRADRAHRAAPLARRPDLAGSRRRWPGRCSPACCCRSASSRCSASSTRPCWSGPVVLAWLVDAPDLAPLGGARVAGGGARAWCSSRPARRSAGADLLPALAWTTPAWTVPAVVSIAVPLYIVTMASQNVPGVAVHVAASATPVPWRESMTRDRARHPDRRTVRRARDQPGRHHRRHDRRPDGRRRPRAAVGRDDQRRGDVRRAGAGRLRPGRPGGRRTGSR